MAKYYVGLSVNGKDPGAATVYIQIAAEIQKPQETQAQ